MSQAALRKSSMRDGYIYHGDEFKERNFGQDVLLPCDASENYGYRDGAVACFLFRDYYILLNHNRISCEPPVRTGGSTAFGINSK